MNEPDRNARDDIIQNRKLQLQLRELQVSLEVSALCGWGNTHVALTVETNIDWVVRNIQNVRNSIDTLESQLLAGNGTLRKEIVGDLVHMGRKM